VNLEAFVDKGKWRLEVSTNKSVFLNMLRLEFSSFEAKVFYEGILCVKSIRSILLSHFLHVKSSNIWKQPSTAFPVMQFRSSKDACDGVICLFIFSDLMKTNGFLRLLAHLDGDHLGGGRW